MVYRWTTRSWPPFLASPRTSSSKPKYRPLLLQLLLLPLPLPVLLLLVLLLLLLLLLVLVVLVLLILRLLSFRRGTHTPTSPIAPPGAHISCSSSTAQHGNTHSSSSSSSTDT